MRMCPGLEPKNPRPYAKKRATASRLETAARASPRLCAAWEHAGFPGLPGVGSPPSTAEFPLTFPGVGGGVQRFPALLSSQPSGTPRTLRLTSPRLDRQGPTPLGSGSNLGRGKQQTTHAGDQRQSPGGRGPGAAQLRLLHALIWNPQLSGRLSIRHPPSAHITWPRGCEDRGRNVCLASSPGASKP